MRFFKSKLVVFILGIFTAVDFSKALPSSCPSNPSIMDNADVARLINSTEVQAAVRPAIEAPKTFSFKVNPLSSSISISTIQWELKAPMMRLTTLATFALASILCAKTHGFSMSMSVEKQASIQSRRGFFSAATAAAAVVTSASFQPIQNAAAAPTVYKLDNGVKYAITQDVTKGSYPQEGDIIAIEYTGYLANGAIFDATHSQGKKNALLFKIGSSAVNQGINSMVSEMKVGQKVQAIIPPELAFGEKGICLENGECLVKPGATLVYDIFLKKASIPPP